MSLVKGKDEDEERTMQQLRLALIDCYISIIHGLADVEEEHTGYQQPQMPQSNTFIEPHARSIHMYLEELLNQDLVFEQEMLSNMFELYIDLVTIFMADHNLPDSRTGHHENNLCLYMMQGNLHHQLNHCLGSQGRKVNLET